MSQTYMHKIEPLSYVHQKTRHKVWQSLLCQFLNVQNVLKCSLLFKTHTSAIFFGNVSVMSWKFYFLIAWKRVYVLIFSTDFLQIYSK